jgi:DNA mismatch endonuclease (patch repair protein)
MLWAMGWRYRLQRRDLPGRPDLAFIGRGTAVFVHGCFWHGHDCPRGSRRPKQNADYWAAKIGRNKARDAAAQATLTERGWRALIVWECELKNEAAVAARLDQALRASRGASSSARQASIVE